jgi:hypothetical protein
MHGSCGICGIRKKGNFIYSDEKNKVLEVTFDIDDYQQFHRMLDKNKEKDGVKLIFKCDDIDNHKTVNFYDFNGLPFRVINQITKTGRTRETLEFKPQFYVKQEMKSGLRRRYSEVYFSFDELSSFIESRRFFEVVEEQGSWHLIKTEETHKSFEFHYKNREMILDIIQTVIETNHDKNEPLLIKPMIRITFNSLLYSDEIYLLLLELNQFFCILFNRKNIYLNEIGMTWKNNDGLLLADSMGVIYRFELYKSDDNINRARCLKLGLIENSLGKALDIFLKGEISWGQLLDTEHDFKVTPDKFIMCVATFESLFAAVYSENNKIEHSDAVNTFYNSIKEYILGYPKINNRVENKKKYIISKIDDDYRKSLLESMKLVLNDNSVLREIIIKHFSNGLNLNDCIDNITKRISTTRIRCAHGKPGIFDSDFDFKDFIILRIMVTLLTLKYLNIDANAHQYGIWLLHGYYIG